MALKHPSNLDPVQFETSTATAFLSSLRTDLSNTYTITHSAANTLTFSGGIVATNFTGNGSGLTNLPVPPSTGSTLYLANVCGGL
jgi:hypothetical protein